MSVIPVSTRKAAQLGCSHANDTTQHSGSPPVTTDIGAEITACNALVSNVLESGPVLGIDQGPLAEPLRDGLLGDGRSPHELRESCGKQGLIANNLDGPHECGHVRFDNVRFLHNARAYTTRVVQVNDTGCVPNNNAGCNVVYLSDRIGKIAAMPARNAPARIREAEVGPDNRTLGDRLKLAMNRYAKSHGRGTWEGFTQAEWVDLATRAVGKNPDKELVMSQQNLSLILNNKSSGPDGVIAFALLLGVEAAWLQYGFGPPTDLDSAQYPKRA